MPASPFMEWLAVKSLLIPFISFSYSNVLMLRNAWTLHDLESCSVWPDAIAEGQLSISIIDNDDFLSDTLTGRGTSLGCNWMFLQCLEQQLLDYQANAQEKRFSTKEVKTLSFSTIRKCLKWRLWYHTRPPTQENLTGNSEIICTELSLDSGASSSQLLGVTNSVLIWAWVSHELVYK